MIYIASFFMFLFVLAFAYASFVKLFYKEKSIDKLKYYEENYSVKEKIENHKKNKFSLLKLLSNLVPKWGGDRKRRGKLKEELIKADLEITVEELLVIKVLSSSSFAFLGYSLSKDLIIVFLLFILVWNIPKYMIKKRKNERLKLFNEQINEGIMIISNSLKAGYSFLQAVAVVVEETKDPFSKEFKKVLKEMSLGVSTEDALKGMLKRVDSEDLKLVIMTILIQKDIGGNLSEILDTISQTIRDRQKIQNELKTLTAQGKMSGMIISLMPFILGIIIYLLNKEYVSLLFTTSIGLTMTIIAIINQVFGIFMISKIIKIDM